MENGMSTSNLTRIGWVKTLEDLGYQAKFVHEDHLRSGALEREGFKVLLLNRALALSDAEAAAIQAFAAKGGVVLADHLTGLFDEHGKARERGALDDLFGVHHDLSKGILGGKTLTEADAERGGQFSPKTWAIEGAPLHQGMPVFERGLTAAAPAKGGDAAGTAVVVRKGKHAYLNLSAAGHLLKRSQGESREWLDLVASLLADAGLHPRVSFSVGGERARMTEGIFWKNGDRMTLCVVQNLDRRATIDSFGTTQGGTGDQAVTLKLGFTQPVKGLTNERTGKVLGDGREFEDAYLPWEANVYTFTP
jgi:hypothetical protein